MGTHSVRSGRSAWQSLAYAPREVVTAPTSRCWPGARQTAAALYPAVGQAREGLSAPPVHDIAPLGFTVTTLTPCAFSTDLLATHSIRNSDPGERGPGRVAWSSFQRA